MKNLARMRDLTRFIQLLVSFFIFSGLGCSNDSADGEAQQFDQLVRSGSGFARQAEELSTPEIIQPNVERPSMRTDNLPVTGGGMEMRQYSCTTHRYRAAPGYNELFLLNPTADVIYPAPLLTGLA